jgi:peptidoglycan hydrolase-like protein with peptidoglycan-binding domain
VNQANSEKQVKAVQTILNSIGYGLSVDGQCGTATINAIKAFQTARNLGNDGIVGTNTWRALGSAKYFTYGTSIWGSMS